MKSNMKTISARNNVFFRILKNFDFYDISKFWKIPYTQILKEVKQIPEEYWRKPFNGEGDQVERMNLQFDCSSPLFNKISSSSVQLSK